MSEDSHGAKARIVKALFLGGVAAGTAAGIVRLSDMHIGRDIRAGRLVRILEGLQVDAEEPLYVVYASKRNLSLRVSAFLDFVNEKFRAGWDSV